MSNKSKLMNKVKYFIGLDDLDEEFEDTYSNVPEDIDSISEKRIKDKKIVNIHTNTNIRLAIHQPSRYEDTTKIVEDLKSRKPVVINLQNLESEVKRKVFDFMNGAVYALEGTIQKITKDIFVLAPSNVEIDGRIKEEIKTKGIFNWK
ncbi:cell division protein SepF [Clostridiisalibacter paucivorans]|uniref:cell division protein SepF n=1 Tax=Clostridiisalibacter paucivorans TaxID=408753 RepID=UPI00047CC156|nr:cell division protein SepF [Clostridiisalibacter paucivorans]